MRRFLSICSALVVLMLGLSLTALAHGGGTPQLTNEPVDSYLLSAWTSPNPALVGAVHVTAALAEASTGAAVTDPEVHVTALPVSGAGAPITAEATHVDAEIPIFYEADLQFPAAGDWRLTIAIDGAGGTGTATFTLPVRPAGPNWLVLGLVGAGIVLVAGVGWMLLRGGGADRRRRPVAPRSVPDATTSEGNS